MLITGGCGCGAVRYEIGGKLNSLCFCHCHSCRRASGAPFVAWGTSLKNNLVLTAGKLALHASSEKVQRGFCQQCGTCLTYANAATPATIDIALATFDQPNAVKPEFHIWLDDKLDWVVVNDGLPAYPGWRTP